MTKKIDSVCLIHGKKMSEHLCLYCCLCWRSLTPDECNIKEDGQKEDVCKSCAKKEKRQMKKLKNKKIKRRILVVLILMLFYISVYAVLQNNIFALTVAVFVCALNIFCCYKLITIRWINKPKPRN